MTNFNDTEIIFHKVDELPGSNLINYIGHVFFTTSGGIYMCRRTPSGEYEWKPFGSIVDPGIVPTYEEILAIAQGKCEDLEVKFNGKFSSITNIENEIRLTVADLNKDLTKLNADYSGFVSEIAVLSNQINMRLTQVENGQESVKTLLSLGLDKSVLRMEGLVDGITAKTSELVQTVDGIQTNVTNLDEKVTSEFSQIDSKIEAKIESSTFNTRLAVAEGKIESSTGSIDGIRSELVQIPGRIEATVEDKTSDMRSAIKQMPDEIAFQVEEGTKAAKIVQRINDDKSSEVRINADKIKLEGSVFANALQLGEDYGEDEEGENYTKIEKDGLLKARNAIIHGSIYAGEGHIGGLNIDTDGSLYVKDDSGRDIYRLGADGKLIAKNAELTGKITADEGYIGNVEIKDGSLRGGNNFRLSSDGLLTVKNASVEGEISADSGNIGGFIIDSNGIHDEREHLFLNSDGTIEAWVANIHGNIEASSGHIGNLALSEGGFKSDNGNFSLTGEGLLTVKNADVQGNIKAVSGEIGDIYKLIVDSSGIYSTGKYGQKSWLVGSPEDKTNSDTISMTGIFKSPAVVYEGNSFVWDDDPVDPSHGYYPNGYLPQAIRYSDVISSINGNGSLPSGVEYIGRHIWIGNCDPAYMSGGGSFDTSSTMKIEGNPDSGTPLYYFYENGVRSTNLHISNEFVELLGYGTCAGSQGEGTEYKFRGYIVLNRNNVCTAKTYGNTSRTLAYAKVENGSSSLARVFNGKGITSSSNSDITYSFSGGLATYTFNTLKVDPSTIHVCITPVTSRVSSTITAPPPVFYTAEVYAPFGDYTPLTVFVRAYSGGSQTTSSSDFNFTMSLHNMNDFISFSEQSFRI